MDSLTHIFLGAAIGELTMGKKLGKQAMLLGAFANSIPDFDFIASFFLPTTADLLAHRGFTHSFLFLVLLSPLLALLARRVGRTRGFARWLEPRMGAWTAFFSLEIFVHIFLDAFNGYGTGWFEPFSHYRVSFNTLFVADPLFTIVPAIAFFVLLFRRMDFKARKKWAVLAVALPSIYLVYALFNKNIIQRSLARQSAKTERYFSTPTALNSMLWYVVQEKDSGYNIGYRSVFDRNDTIDFVFFPRNEHLLRNVKDVEDINRLKRFSQNYYTIQKSGPELVFNDLRFGQVIGWIDPHEEFVFHYFLQQPKSNDMVVQRGRFAKWDAKAVELLLKRIRGN
ncbi:MAG: metal-dependent hydrolase [Gemmatimonadaceae bacterium]|nr:metal-dependent hydrolase [Chitinophagaceae bacterium]